MTVATATESTSIRVPLARSERSIRTAELLEVAAQETCDARRKEFHDEVLLINLGVAHALARRFARKGVDLEDLEQVASEALIKAVRRFDPSQHHDFLSYAVPTIRGELQRHFRDHGWMIRPTRRVQETQWRAVRVADELSKALGRQPLAAEVVQELGVTPEDYAEAQAARGCFRPASLDQPVSTNGDGDVLGASLPVEDLGFSEREARAIVMPALSELPERDREVLYLRFFEELTQSEIGERLGVGQAQVSRIIASALAKLRSRVTPAPGPSPGAHLRVVRSSDVVGVPGPRASAD